MILADKIIALRKKAGWSQEELAQQLGVTRQSVSKWEGVQSIPDLDKILQMSRIFGVSTDYLLKDEQDEADSLSAVKEESALRRVSMEEASTYLSLRKAAAPRIALATLLCMMSPILLIFLAGASDTGYIAISEDSAAGLGLCVMVALVAVAVALFISAAAKSREYSFLESEPFETEYGVSGMVTERKKAHRAAHTRATIFGTVMCILSVMPLFLAQCFNADDMTCIASVCVLLAMVAIGCFAFVYSGVYHAAMQKLLEEEDYNREAKAKKPVAGTISLIYWLAVTAIYLFVTFWPGIEVSHQYSWIIWAVAGVLFGAVMGTVKLLGKK